MPNVRGRVAKQEKQLPPPLPGDGILRAVRASASSPTVLQKGRCEAEIAMTGSGCAARAEIGADAAGVIPQGVEKPRARDKTVRVTPEAYDKATTRALETETDRKTVVSEAILKDCAGPEVPADLSHLKAEIILFLTDTLIMLKESPEEVSGERIAVFKILIREYPRLAAIPEKSSSTNEHALASKLEEVCYPEPERLKEWQRWRESLAAGDQPET